MAQEDLAVFGFDAAQERKVQLLNYFLSALKPSDREALASDRVQDCHGFGNGGHTQQQPA